MNIYHNMELCSINANNLRDKVSKIKSGLKKSHHETINQLLINFNKLELQFDTDFKLLGYYDHYLQIPNYPKIHEDLKWYEKITNIHLDNSKKQQNILDLIYDSDFSSSFFSHLRIDVIKLQENINKLMETKLISLIIQKHFDVNNSLFRKITPCTILTYYLFLCLDKDINLTTDKNITLLKKLNEDNYFENISHLINEKLQIKTLAESQINHFMHFEIYQNYYQKMYDQDKKILAEINNIRDKLIQIELDNFSENIGEIVCYEDYQSILENYNKIWHQAQFSNLESHNSDLINFKMEWGKIDHLKSELLSLDEKLDILKLEHKKCISDSQNLNMRQNKLLKRSKLINHIYNQPDNLVSKDNHQFLSELEDKITDVTQNAHNHNMQIIKNNEKITELTEEINNLQEKIKNHAPILKNKFMNDIEQINDKKNRLSTENIKLEKKNKIYHSENVYLTTLKENINSQTETAYENNQFLNKMKNENFAMSNELYEKNKKKYETLQHFIDCLNHKITKLNVFKNKVICQQKTLVLSVKNKRLRCLELLGRDKLDLYEKLLRINQDLQKLVVLLYRKKKNGENREYCLNLRYKIHLLNRDDNIMEDHISHDILVDFRLHEIMTDLHKFQSIFNQLAFIKKHLSYFLPDYDINLLETIKLRNRSQFNHLLDKYKKDQKNETDKLKEKHYESLDIFFLHQGDLLKKYRENIGRIKKIDYLEKTLISKTDKFKKITNLILNT